MNPEQIFYAPKLGQEFSFNQVGSQTGLPPDCSEEVLHSLGFFRVVDPFLHTEVFSDGPYGYHQEGTEILKVPIKWIEEVEEVRSRAENLLLWEFRKDCLSIIRGDRELLEDCVLSLLLGSQWPTSGVNSLKRLDNNHKELMASLASCETIQEIKTLLVENELFVLPA